MPDYSEPGNFVSESDRNPHPIVGLSVSTAAFIGLVQSRSAGRRPTPVASLAEYEQAFGSTPASTFLRHALRGYFQNGGTRCYIHRLEPGCDLRQGVQALRDLDVSIVACPDAVSLPGIEATLIAHCEEMRYRLAILDAPQGPPPMDGPPAELRSSYAAYYYPRVMDSDCADEIGVAIPACGHIAGTYARTDRYRGVWQAPANEQLLGISGLEQSVTSSEQQAMASAGVNVLRNLPGKGSVVWGARTTSDDPDWKYVNVRRLFIYLERSIEQGTKWAVFEPNDEGLWERVKRSVSDFLYSTWSSGGLVGDSPDDAFFVRCDRTTMTQDDIDNGRLVVEIGFAPLRPAEFVIFRIGQWTAEARCKERC